MTEAQREMLRRYIEGVITDGEWGGDWIHELIASGLDPLLIWLIQMLGYLLAMLGGW